MAVQPYAPDVQPYTAATVDMVTGRWLHRDLPVRVESYSHTLGRAGRARATVPLRDARVYASQVLEATTPGRTELWIMRGGVPVWDGVIWRRSYRARDGLLTLQASETVRWWLERRLLRPLDGNWRNLEFTQTDQLEIFRALVADATSVTVGDTVAGDLRLDLGDALSGVLRDRHISYDDAGDQEDSSYQSWDFARYLDRLDDLADLDNGCEWRADPYISAQDEPRRRLVLGYPYIGRQPGTDTVALEYPGTVADLDWDEDASDTATYVAALGAGEESELRWAEHVDAAAISDGWPLLEATATAKDVSDLGTLAEVASAAGRRLAGPAEIPEVEVIGRPDVRLGDWVRLRVQDPARWPDTDQAPREWEMRTIGLESRPGQVETTRLTLEEAR